ncbi:MAG: DUF6653 family protein [Candidatus Paceibacteria bacterium]
MAILSEATWERHANPWSGWTRALSMSALAVGLYLHSFWILGAVAFWLIINPMLFPKPKSVDNWMSKGVLGEQLYYKDGKKFKKDLPTLLNVINAPVFVAFIYLGWQQELMLLILAGILTRVIKFWFIDRMVCLIDGEVI